MSDIGLILILAVLVSGGVIATIGDRLGSRVGKARLSLFKLRPKNTATVVTILTGTMISASTLGILLAASSQFRAMLLNFGRIQTNLKNTSRELQRTRDELKSTNDQKAQVQNELNQARSERVQVEAQLNRINQSLKTAVKKQSETNAQLKRAEEQRDLIRGQLTTVSQQAVTLRSEITQLQSEQKSLIKQRDQVKAQIAARDEEIAERTRIIEQRDREIGERNQIIANREARLKELEAQQALLAEAVQQSEQEAQMIRSGSLALLRNQVLSAGVVRITDPKAAKQAVDQALQEANRVALQSIQPGVPEDVQIVQITTPEVQRLIDQINDGRDYVVRIIAAANYVRGERRPVAVYANAVPNQVLFLAGDVLAAKWVDPSKMSSQEFQKSLEQLLAFSNFRARRAGVLTEGVQIDNLQSLAPFLEQLRRYQTPVEIRAVASDATSTIGPLKIELVAVQNGQIILRTASRG